jgi:site-specific recombinase XerD
MAAAEYLYCSHRLGLGFTAEERSATPWIGSVMRYYTQPAARRAGITKKIGWHTFRHTFSTLIKSLGVDAKVVQELLRHASFKTTMDG